MCFAAGGLQKQKWAVLVAAGRVLSRHPAGVAIIPYGPVPPLAAVVSPALQLQALALRSPQQNVSHKQLLPALPTQTAAPASGHQAQLRMGAGKWLFQLRTQPRGVPGCGCLND